MKTSDKKIYLFLDIDGVLSTDEEFDTPRTKFWEKYDIAGTLKIPYPYNPECVKVFNEICENFEPIIVLSSDWKLHWKLDEMNQIFEFNKINYKITDYTPKITKRMYDYEGNRALEIKEYIKEHNIEYFLVLDDLYMDEFFDKSTFIRTNSLNGINEKGIKQKIIKTLQKHEN